MSIVIPFPLARRRQLVERCVGRMLDLTAEAAERHLDALLKMQADAMDRRAMDRSVIDREIKALEAAVRSELWHRVIARDGSS